MDKEHSPIFTALYRVNNKYCQVKNFHYCDRYAANSALFKGIFQKARQQISEETIDYQIITTIICFRKISEILLLRDTTLIPNVLWFEYTNTRQEVRARSRKLVSMKSQ